MTIDVIYGKKYRRTAHIMDLNEMEVTAPNWHAGSSKIQEKRWHGTAEKISTIPLMMMRYSYYTMIIREDGRQDQTSSGSYRRNVTYHENTIS